MPACLQGGGSGLVAHALRTAHMQHHTTQPLAFLAHAALTEKQFPTKPQPAQLQLLKGNAKGRSKSSKAGAAGGGGSSSDQDSSDSSSSDKEGRGGSRVGKKPAGRAAKAAARKLPPTDVVILSDSEDEVGDVRWKECKSRRRVHTVGRKRELLSGGGKRCCLSKEIRFASGLIRAGRAGSIPLRHKNRYWSINEDEKS